MTRKIIVYGNPDKSELGFPMPGDLRQYIASDIFENEHGRYRYTQGKDADLIVLSREGLAYGHLDVVSKHRPSGEDRRRYPRVKFVYLIRRSMLYENPVELSQLGIVKIRFGKSLNETEFAKIQKLAGRRREFEEIRVPGELPIGKYHEGAVRRVLLNSYEWNAAAVEACKAHYGTRCQACDLDLGEQYGGLGKGFIHVHHLKQLSTIGKRYEVDPVNDLRPICPNCHAIRHLKSPPLTIEELRSHLKHHNDRKSRGLQA